MAERRKNVQVELVGSWKDASGKIVPAGPRTFDSPASLTPTDASSSFAVEGITIGIGFHWERQERQAFRGGLRIIERDGLTIINDVDLEEYVTSVISSEMSASCPSELLKAHAVISRSWVWFPKAHPEVRGQGNASIEKPGEIIRWYGREAHESFDVCADDHCQRYQGITKAFSPSVEQAVNATRGQMLRYDGRICDARFSKCCGGLTEAYAVAWDDQVVPYLVSFSDRDPSSREPYCNTTDEALIRKILPDFDQETRDFYRWRVEYGADELGELVKARLGQDLGRIVDLLPLARGASGRIHRLQIVGSRDTIIIGKELEIRRALSRSHLYSSAFDVDKAEGRFVLRGAGWGHGVGLCQIGAAVMANEGKSYQEILAHYYPGAQLL